MRAQEDELHQYEGIVLLIIATHCYVTDFF